MPEIWSFRVGRIGLRSGLRGGVSVEEGRRDWGSSSPTVGCASAVVPWHRRALRSRRRRRRRCREGKALAMLLFFSVSFRDAIHGCDHDFLKPGGTGGVGGKSGGVKPRRVLIERVARYDRD
jgi:hypothetical protein